MDRFYEQFGRRLRAARDSVGLTQDELATRVGLTRGSIANIERGTQAVSLARFVGLAGALGVEPGTLLPQADEALEPLRRAIRDAGYPAEYVAWGERAVSRTDDDDPQDEGETVDP